MPHLRLFRPEQTRRPAALAPGFVAAYVVLGILAYVWTTSVGGLAVLWVCNGLLTAALLLLSARQAVVVALMCAMTDFLSALLTSHSVARAALIAGCDLSEAITAAVLIRRFCGAGLDMNVLPRFRNFVLMAAIPSTVLFGTLGAALSAGSFGDRFTEVWTAWVLGDFLGMMMGAPTALLLTRFRRYEAGAVAGAPERAVLIVTVSAVAAVIFNLPQPLLLFLLFPIGLLVIIRLGTPYAALSVLVIAFIAAQATVTGRGPIGANPALDNTDRVLLLQFYLATVVFSAIVLSSVLAGRARAQAGLRRALAASRAARKEALAAAGAKGRFLAVMSHEMRTPLNGVAGHAQVLAARPDLPAEVREQIGVIQSSCQVLLSLINDVLDYSRTDSGALQLSCAPFSLAEVCRRMCKIVGPALDHRPIELSLDVAPAEGLLHLGDERRVAQIVLNLLGNAVKFTERGAIAVQATLAPGADGTDLIRVSVTDTGIGVPHDMQGLLFRPFSQVDNGTTRNFEGAGLGLAISKSLVELMGGRIGVISGPGPGSEFWFELPLRRTEAPALTLVPPPASGDFDPTGRRVLVVDDHPVNRQVATMILTAAGFDVEHAENGAEAVDAVRDNSFDVVFMDLHMPVMDGLAASRAIRALEGPAGRVPIIAMTAAALPEDVERCLAAGMDAHIAKPIDHHQLVLLAQQDWRRDTAIAV